MDDEDLGGADGHPSLDSLNPKLTDGPPVDVVASASRIIGKVRHCHANQGRLVLSEVILRALGLETPRGVPTKEVCSRRMWLVSRQ